MQSGAVSLPYRASLLSQTTCPVTAGQSVVHGVCCCQLQVP